MLTLVQYKNPVWFDVWLKMYKGCYLHLPTEMVRYYNLELVDEDKDIVLFLIQVKDKEYFLASKLFIWKRKDNFFTFSLKLPLTRKYFKLKKNEIYKIRVKLLGIVSKGDGDGLGNV